MRFHVALLALPAILFGCPDSENPPPESNATSRVSSGGGDDGAGPTCSPDSFEACGGDIVGSWRLARTCPDMNSEIVVDDSEACATSVIATSIKDYNVTLSFGGDGSHESTFSLRFIEDIVMTEACLATLVAGSEEFEDYGIEDYCDEMSFSSDFDASCSLSEDRCACRLSGDFSGAESGPYSADNGLLTTVVDDEPYSEQYCVSGSTLETLSPALDESPARVFTFERL